MTITLLYPDLPSGQEVRCPPGMNRDRAGGGPLVSSRPALSRWRALAGGSPLGTAAAGEGLQAHGHMRLKGAQGHQLARGTALGYGGAGLLQGL